MTPVLAHIKAFIHLFADPHTLFTMLGFGIIFTPEMIDEATAWVKLIAAILGLGVVFLTGFHKWLQIKNEKRNGKI